MIPLKNKYVFKDPIEKKKRKYMNIIKNYQIIHERLP